MQSRLTILLPLLLLAACSTSEAHDNDIGPTPDAGDAIAPLPQPQTVSCGDFCSHALTCVADGDEQACLQSCSAFSATCRNCFVSRSCPQIESGQCDSLCLEQEGDPTGGKDCTPITYSAGSIGDGTNQGNNGSACFFPGDCLSHRCVHAQLTELTSKDFCGSKGDCRSPNNADEVCPSGWQCVEISQDAWENEGLQYICVPPDIDVCPTPGSLF